MTTDGPTKEELDETGEVLDRLADELEQGEGTDDATGSETEAEETGGDSQGSERKFTQAELDRIVTERLEREKKQRKKAEEKARDEAQAKALEEQQEYQKLSETYRKKVETLETEVERLKDEETKREKYEGALTKRLASEMEGVPDYVQSLLEGRDPVDQLNWITENREKIKSSEVRDIDSSVPAGDLESLSSEQKKVNQDIASRQVRNIF